MHIAGRVDYDPTQQTSSRSGGPSDIQTVAPPRGVDAVAFTVESPPIRVTFDGKRPTPTHGLLLRSGDHFFPFAKQMKFASVEQGREAIVNFLWLRLAPKQRG
ncbi:MAG TPA: hypothetical protein VH297_10590 [Gaiellaceae bacterium]|jgi:hypothetical protein